MLRPIVAIGQVMPFGYSLYVLVPKLYVAKVMNVCKGLVFQYEINEKEREITYRFLRHIPSKKGRPQVHKYTNSLYMLIPAKVAKRMDIGKKTSFRITTDILEDIVTYTFVN